MRYSVNPNDPGYANYQAAKPPFEAYLDGVPVKHVVTADEDLGLIVRQCCDVGGALMVDRKNWTIVTEELHGRVRVATGSAAVRQPAWKSAAKPGRTHGPMT